jgi:hypothetical protein
MRRLRLVLACAVLVLLAVPATSLSAERMLIGFQDDPSFRWREDRAAVLDKAYEASAGILRTTVYWSKVAERRPAQPTNPFDSAYRFDDLDEFVRAAQFRGAEVMLTIWGTPGWANRGRGQNRAPTNVQDLGNFARAVATRYSGRFPGLPFVRYFSVWNESNLEQFLAPTFNSAGKPVSPFTYARMYRAVYAGIKAGNRAAKVGLGETSPRGRDRLSPAPGRLQNTIAPGTFARLLSTVRPRLQFDAYSHHPYSELGRPPTQRVRFPNVNLTQMSQFEASLKKWFGRKSIPMWVTEYAFETKPGEPKGVTQAQQAAYARTAINMVRRDPNVEIFIWFILRDDPTSTWQSGLLNRDGTKKPAFDVFASLARLYDGRNPLLAVKANVTNPVVRVPVLELAARTGIGSRIGATVRVFNGTTLLGVSQPTSTIAIDGWTSFPAPLRTTAGRRYRVTFEINDPNGNSVNRTATLVAS